MKLTYKGKITGDTIKLSSEFGGRTGDRVDTEEELNRRAHEQTNNTADPVVFLSAHAIIGYYDPEDSPSLPELRKDPITGRWVIIATDRAKRP